jgi:hypothetical protein
MSDVRKQIGQDREDHPIIPTLPYLGKKGPRAKAQARPSMTSTITFSTSTHFLQRNLSLRVQPELDSDSESNPTSN